MDTMLAEKTRGLVGLTTTKAPFIENTRHQRQIYIQQPYELYSEENHQA